MLTVRWFGGRPQGEVMLTRIAPYLIAAFALGLSACTNPYDPV